MQIGTDMLLIIIIYIKCVYIYIYIYIYIQDNLRVKVSALNADLSSPSADLLASKRPVRHDSIKEGYLPEKRLFY